MAKHVIISTPHSDEIPYTIIESLEDIGDVPCHAPEETLIADFKAGKTIIVNNLGGYCFFFKDYHTIVREIK